MTGSSSISTELADRFAIHDLVMNYAKARDTTDQALYREIFAEDAQITGPGGRVLSNSRDSILEKVRTDRIRFNPTASDAGTTYGIMRHLITNVLITIDGDAAESEYYVLTLANNEADKRPEVISEARNTDRYARRDGRWWIVSSALTFGWSNDAMGRVLKVGPYTPDEYKR